MFGVFPKPPHQHPLLPLEYLYTIFLKDYWRNPSQTSQEYYLGQDVVPFVKLIYLDLIFNVTVFKHRTLALELQQHKE